MAVTAGWHPSTWSYEHARYGHFFVQQNRDGTCIASRVENTTVHTIPPVEGTAAPYPMHASLSAALVACERRIEELGRLHAADMEAASGSDMAPAAPLRLVRS